MSYVKVGVAGPVGSGKTALIEALSRKMAEDYSIGVITNDIYTKEDAQFLAKNSVLPVERIIGVETGGCPHTAIGRLSGRSSRKIPGMQKCAAGFWQIRRIFRRRISLQQVSGSGSKMMIWIIVSEIL